MCELFLMYTIFNKSRDLPGKTKTVLFLSKGIKQIFWGKLWQLTTAIGSCGRLYDRLKILPSLPQSCQGSLLAEYSSHPTDFGLDGMT